CGQRLTSLLRRRGWRRVRRDALLRFRLVTTRLPGRAPRGGIWAGARVVTMRTIINRFDSGTPASYLVFHTLLRTRRKPSGFVEPCLPSPAERRRCAGNERKPRACRGF